MPRTPDYKKWYEIYIDKTFGLPWKVLCEKHHTSRHTVHRAYQYFSINLNRIEYHNKIQQQQQHKQQECKEETTKYQFVKDVSRLKNLRTNPPQKSNLTSVSDQTFKIASHEITHLKNWTNLFSHPLDVKIYTLTRIFHEISLSQLAEQLNASKSTISSHVKKLEKNDIIKIRKVPTRARYKKQYISLNMDLETQLNFENLSILSLDQLINYFTSLNRNQYFNFQFQIGLEAIKFFCDNQVNLLNQNYKEFTSSKELIEYYKKTKIIPFISKFSMTKYNKKKGLSDFFKELERDLNRYYEHKPEESEDDEDPIEDLFMGFFIPKKHVKSYLRQ